MVYADNGDNGDISPGEYLMKRQLITGIFSLMTILAIHALGSKDTEDTPVENLDSWLETVDISQKNRENTIFSLLLRILQEIRGLRVRTISILIPIPIFR